MTSSEGDLFFGMGERHARRLRLTSLLRVEERLLESEYFVRQLAQQHHPERFCYVLNAFLSASRSVTFLLQKEFSGVIGFESWWVNKRRVLAQDDAARFFLKLRNFSQKVGRVSFVSGTFGRGKKQRPSHRFAGTADSVPASLLNREIVDCCREYLAKLAALILECADAFPYHACPRRALTPEGVAFLGLRLNDVEKTLGFPPGYTATATQGNRDERIRILREQVDGVDFRTIGRISRLKARPAREPVDSSDALSENILSSIVESLERRNTPFGPLELVSSLLRKPWPPETP